MNNRAAFKLKTWTHTPKAHVFKLLSFCLQKRPQYIVKWLRLGAASVCVYICVCVFISSSHLLLKSPELDKKPFPPHTLCTYHSQCKITPHTSRLFFYWGTQEDSYIPKLKIILPKDEHRRLGSPHQYSTEKVHTLDFGKKEVHDYSYFIQPIPN